MAAGQSWKHGWIPLSPGAAKQKNHGRSVKDGSWVTKLAGGSVSAKHMDTAIRGAGHGPQLKMVEDAKPSKAPRDLKPGDVVHFHGVPVTVLSHPRESAVRGYKSVWGRRHDTGAHGRLDFTHNDQMDVHGREKVSPADVKAHAATLKTGLDAKRARLNGEVPSTEHNDPTDAVGKPTRYANESKATRNAVHRALARQRGTARAQQSYMVRQSDGSWLVQDEKPTTKPYVRVTPARSLSSNTKTEWVR